MASRRRIIGQIQYFFRSIRGQNLYPKVSINREGVSANA